MANTELNFEKIETESANLAENKCCPAITFAKENIAEAKAKEAKEREQAEETTMQASDFPRVVGERAIPRISISETIDKVLEPIGLEAYLRPAEPVGYWVHDKIENPSYVGGYIYLRSCTCSECGYRSHVLRPAKCPSCGITMQG